MSDIKAMEYPTLKVRAFVVYLSDERILGVYKWAQLKYRWTHS